MLNSLSISIICIYGFSKGGDISHVDAVYEAIASKGSAVRENINAALSEDEIRQQLRELITNKGSLKTLLLFVGEDGLRVAEKALPYVEQNFPHIKTVISVHQYFDYLDSVKQFTDLLILPKASADYFLKEKIKSSFAKVYFGEGVPTKNPSKSYLKVSYDGWELKDKYPINKPYIVIMLPGDAPDGQDKQKLFTIDSAKELFESVKALWENNGKKHGILVQNGPRTGKYDIDGKTVVCSHEYKAGSGLEDNAIDGISRYFISLLKDESIPYGFFNFAFEVQDGGKRVKHSVYDQLLFLSYSHPESYYVVPGESVTMLSQIPLYTHPDRVIVFKSSSMNRQHESIFDEFFNQGLFSYFLNKKIEQPKKFSADVSHLDTANQVSEKILDLFKEGDENLIWCLVNADADCQIFDWAA
jgi:hypothetical protein